jgi:hypothetical protein
MGKKPKAGRDLGKDRSQKEAKMTQAERFIGTAREIGVDETGKEFELAVAKLVPTSKSNKR